MALIPRSHLSSSMRGYGRTARDDVVPVLIFTPREAECLRLMALGQRNYEIATTMIISRGYVKTLLYDIFQKIGCRNRVEAARYVWEHGISVSS